MIRAVLCWSGGKDSAWALHALRASGVEIVALLSTVYRDTGRTAMHETPRELLEAQAESAGVPLWTVPLPCPCPNAEYERAMGEACRNAVEAGISHMAFGDIFLADVRRYREEKLAGTGLAPLFPLWGCDTAALAREMVAAGIAARVVSIDAARLPREFAGRPFDGAFLADLPAGVDPCGENGEFHTFVSGGPMFRRPVPVRFGEAREEAGFVYIRTLAAGIHEAEC